MTNEQLAVLIGQGGNDELIPLLWENVRNFIYMMSDRYYYMLRNKFDSYGVTEWDIKQAAYTAFLKAIPAYCEKADSGIKFLSFLKYPFKNVIRDLTCSKDPLNSALSLDVPIGDEYEQEISFADSLCDSAASEPFDEFENTDEQRDISEIVRNAVNRLDEKKRYVIEQRYFNNRIQKSIASDLHLTKARIAQIEKNALKELRKFKGIVALGESLGYTSEKQYHNNLTTFKQTGMTNVEAVAIKRADICQSVREKRIAAKQQMKIKTQSNTPEDTESIIIRIAKRNFEYSAIRKEGLTKAEFLALLGTYYEKGITIDYFVEKAKVIK